MLTELQKFCKVEKDRVGSEQTFILSFVFDEAIVTIRIILNDASGADVVITNMTTLPREKRETGYGRNAIRTILRIAQENGLSNIIATQVQEESEGFWKKVGFVPINNSTNDFACREPKT